MYIQKLTGRPIEGPELIGNVPLIHHLYEVINLKINIELNFVWNVAHCHIFGVFTRSAPADPNAQVIFFLMITERSAPWLVMVLFFLSSRHVFLASFLFLLQGVLLGWASRNSLSVFIKRRNPISKSFPKEFLSYYEKIMSQTWQMSRLGKF